MAQGTGLSPSMAPCSKGLVRAPTPETASLDYNSDGHMGRQI